MHARGMLLLCGMLTGLYCGDWTVSPTNPHRDPYIAVPAHLCDRACLLSPLVSCCCTGHAEQEGRAAPRGVHQGTRTHLCQPGVTYKEGMLVWYMGRYSWVCVLEHTQGYMLHSADGWQQFLSVLVGPCQCPALAAISRDMLYQCAWTCIRAYQGQLHMRYNTGSRCFFFLQLRLNAYNVRASSADTALACVVPCSCT